MNRPDHRDIAALNYARLLGMEAVYRKTTDRSYMNYWRCRAADDTRDLHSWTEHDLAWLYLIHFHIGIDADGNAYDNRRLFNV